MRIRPAGAEDREFILEAWARARGFAMLTLNVFMANDRARHLYERAGFREEWIRCIKRL